MKTINKYIDHRFITNFFKDLINYRKILWDIAVRDFKNGFLSSYLGLLWSFLQPLVTIMVLWFVFQVGFKAPPASGNIPFILWLSAGMIPWFFFSDALNKSTNSLVEYSYLIKKVVFKIKFLPLIKIVSALFIHLILVVIIAVFMCCYGFYPNFYWLQLFYFLFCFIVLILGLSWITASLNVFARDVSQIINVLLQIGFWATPIFWDPKIMSQKMQLIFKLNPVFYIIEGYRESLLYRVDFWTAHWQWTIYFWIFTIVIFLLGGIIFKKTKPYFANVL